MLEVTDLVKHFPIKTGVVIDHEVARVRAVDGVSLTLNEAGYVVEQSNTAINRAVDRGVIKAKLQRRGKTRLRKEQILHGRLRHLIGRGHAPPLEIGEDREELVVAEIGPHLAREREFRVGAFPEQKIAEAQRRGHKRQAKRLHRTAAGRRKDALHKFSRKIVNEYQTIKIGDVSSQKLAKQIHTPAG